jgi:DNA replication licensing factor MCM6
VREAYTLLRQSIIHVEQDDIDFDEEELEGERDHRRQRAAAADPTDDVDGDQDVEMSAAEMEAMDQMEESSMGINGVRVTGAAAGLAAASSSSRASSAAAGADAVPPPPAPKRRMIITHDKYMTLQSLIVLHLSATEREKGRGIDRDELIDWYLELKESEIQDVDELEYEKELITKMLRKLVKVRTACGAIICVLVDHLVCL